MRTPVVIGIVGFAVIAVAVAGWAIWRGWSRSGDSQEAQESDEEPLISMVFFLRQPRTIEAAELTRVVSSAWGGDFDSGQAERYIVGEMPVFVIKDDPWFFIVHVWNKPYVLDREAIEDIKEGRLRKALGEHRAWMSVDLLHGPDGEDWRAEGYRRIGRLMSKLAGKDCIYLFRPETSELVAWSDEIKEDLQSPDPTSALNTFVGVYGIAADDPELRAAEKEARERWPEFVHAFERRRDDQKFSVKAPLSDGNRTEFIWIDVTGIENDVVFGTLGNEPVDLPRYKYKDKVHIPVRDVCDWLYLDGDNLVGGFTRHLFQQPEDER